MKKLKIKRGKGKEGNEASFNQWVNKREPLVKRSKLERKGKVNIRDHLKYWSVLGRKASSN